MAMNYLELIKSLKKYFIKVIDEKDKRKYNLFPSIQVINEFKEWAKIFKGF